MYSPQGDGNHTFGQNDGSEKDKQPHTLNLVSLRSILCKDHKPLKAIQQKLESSYINEDEAEVHRDAYIF